MNLKPVSFALFALGLATAIDQARAEQFTVDSPKISAWMWSQTNAYRKANGVPGLIIEPKIVLVAQEYAEFLARKNMSGHTADGHDPSHRVAAHERQELRCLGELLRGPGQRPISLLGKRLPQKRWRIGSAPLVTARTFSERGPRTWVLASQDGLTMARTTTRSFRSSSTTAYPHVNHTVSGCRDARLVLIGHSASSAHLKVLCGGIERQKKRSEAEAHRQDEWTVQRYNNLYAAWGLRS